MAVSFTTGTSGTITATPYNSITTANTAYVDTSTYGGYSVPTHNFKAGDKLIYIPFGCIVEVVGSTRDLLVAYSGFIVRAEVAHLRYPTAEDYMNL